MGYFLLFAGIGGLIFLIIWKKKRRNNGKSLERLEHLIIMADKGDEEAKWQMYDEVEKQHIDDKQYYEIYINLYKRLAEQGDAFAEKKLGDHYFYENKPNEAYKLYASAANKGNISAMKTLGLRFSEVGSKDDAVREGFGYNAELSFQWYLKAAQYGDSEAMHDVAYAYFAGEGVGKDLNKARYWAQKGAEAGSSECRSFLSDLSRY